MTAEGMNLYDLFETDTKTEKSGVWINYGTDIEKDAGFLVARAGGENTDYGRAYHRRLKPNQKLIQANANNPSDAVIKITRKAHIEAFIEACLLNWRNVRSKERGAIAFNRDNAMTLFMDLPDLFDDLFNKASDLNTFRAQETEEEIKN